MHQGPQAGRQKPKNKRVFAAAIDSSFTGMTETFYEMILESFM